MSYDRSLATAQVMCTLQCGRSAVFFPTPPDVPFLVPGPVCAPCFRHSLSRGTNAENLHILESVRQRMSALLSGFNQVLERNLPDQSPDDYLRRLTQDRAVQNQRRPQIMPPQTSRQQYAGLVNTPPSSPRGDTVPLPWMAAVLPRTPHQPPSMHPVQSVAEDLDCMGGDWE